MPVNAAWTNPQKTSIELIHEGVWTWEEYHAACLQVCDLMREVAYPVDLISAQLPYSVMPSGNPLFFAITQESQFPPNLGRIILVGVAPLAKTVIKALLKGPGGDGSRLVLVDTLDEARALTQAGPQADLTLGAKTGTI